MVQFKPLKIPGRWRDGYALDYQTIKSEFVGYDEFGHPRFDTTRTEIGELLYKLKYLRDQSTVKELVDSASNFVAGRKPGIDAIVPVPPSAARAIQPVFTLGQAIASQLNVAF